MQAKLLTEFAGTFVFLTAIAFSGRSGALAPLVVGLALTAMVYMGGHVSGAHYNPAVSFALYLRGVIGLATMGLYWATQVVAGILAFGFATLLGAHVSGVHPGPGVVWSSALAGEVVFTAALALVVLNVAATKETAGNSYYGLAIGLTVATGAFAVGPISGAAFNPAVGIGATFVSAVSSQGIWSDLWIYIAGPLIGSALGAGIHWLQARAGPVPPEVSERKPD
jgi:aquaporin Z